MVSISKREESGFNCNENYFQNLPDELVLKILQIAVSTENKGEACKGGPRQRKNRLLKAHLRRNNRTYLMDVLGNVSSRFRRITKDRTFWQCSINLDFLSRSEDHIKNNERKLKKILDNFISESARDIAIRGDIPQFNAMTCSYKYREKSADLFGNSVSINANRAKKIFKISLCKDKIKALSSKCPNLVLLSLYKVKVGSWPSEQTLWHSLKELTLSFNESPNTFRGIQLHQIAPNLERFKIEEDGCPPIMLPDMAQCLRLSDVELLGGGHQSFCFPFNYEDLASFPIFPCGLKSLTINMVDFIGIGQLDTMKVLTDIKKFSTRCKIQYEFFKDMTTICSGTL